MKIIAELEWKRGEGPVNFKVLNTTLKNYYGDNVTARELSLLKLYHKFYAAYNRCESNRGCYSCSPRHDCRCEKDRKISDKCTCGRDELEKVETEIDEVKRESHEQE